MMFLLKYNRNREKEFNYVPYQINESLYRMFLFTPDLPVDKSLN